MICETCGNATKRLKPTSKYCSRKCYFVAWRKRIPAHTTHGQTNSPAWSSWYAMQTRCLSPTATGYERYGGAGITICDRWSDFLAFLEDMGERPPGTTLDRKDNSKGYSPDNCQWSTPKQQARNRTITKFVTYLGERMALGDACELAGLSYSTVLNRIIDGWTEDKALNTPVRRWRRHVR